MTRRSVNSEGLGRDKTTYIPLCEHNSLGQRTVNGPDGRYAGVETFCVACGKVGIGRALLRDTEEDRDRLANFFYEKGVDDLDWAGSLELSDQLLEVLRG